MEVCCELFGGDFITGNETLVRIGCEFQWGLERVWTRCRRRRYIFLPCRESIARLPSRNLGDKHAVLTPSLACCFENPSQQFYARWICFLLAVCPLAVCKTSRGNSATGVGNFAAVSVWVWSAWLIIRETLISPSTSSCLHYFGYRSTLRHFWFVLVC
jgi:hypothetical protein